MPKISALHIYPIKSCAGHSVQSATLTPRGFKHDREFMIVDSDNMFMTQRKHPAMALIQPEVTDKTLTLNAPGMDEITIDIQKHGLPETVTVWRSVCEAIDQGDAVAAWLTAYLKDECHLVRMAEDFVRHVNPDYAVRANDQASFADGYPTLVISEASLADLNSRMAAALPMNRFRTNIVVTDCAPFAEDTWQQVRAGEVTFDVVKPCARCRVTTIDQATGVRTSDEPLATLGEYRRVGKGMMFGQNLLHDHNGTLQVGMEMTVLSLK